MRVVLQLALAGAVVAGSVALAADPPTYPVGNFTNATLATVTHSWHVQGSPPASNAFAIGYGSVYLGTGYLSAYAEVTRTKPSPDPATSYVFCHMDWKKGKKTSVNGGTNSKKLSGTEQTALLSEYAYGTNNLIRLADPAQKGSVAGNLTVNTVRGTFSSSFRKGLTLQNFDATYKYDGTVSGGPNDGRTIRGTVRFKGRAMPAGPGADLVR